MNRRTLISAAMVMIGIRGAGAGTGRRIEQGGMTFVWHHADGRLHGRLSAPGSGWMAVGFNDRATLEGTRFVIAAVVDGAVRAEEHIALVPDHVAVTTLGGRSGLADLDGRAMGQGAEIAFSLPERAGDRYAVDLAPGARTHLMLAYAMEPAFDHHSRWRQHFDVIL